jgi:hypothetical protein
VLPITVIEHDVNLGPSAARRSAIASSSATHLAFLDADDLWLPDHLEQLMKAVDVGVAVTADAYRWSPGGRIARRTHRDLSPVPTPDEQREASISGNFVFIGALCSRADYEAAGGFRDGFSGAEDWDLWIRMIRQGVRFAPTASPTCVYRITPGSLTGGTSIFDRYLAVLAAAQRDATEPWELAMIARSIARHEARRALVASQHAARAGEVAKARDLARGVGAIEGRLSLEALALRAAPRLTSAFGDALRDRFRWGVRAPHVSRADAGPAHLE